MLTLYCCSKHWGPSLADTKQLTIAPLRNQDQSPENHDPKNKIIKLITTCYCTN